MTDNYTYVADLREHTRVPENGILSQTLQSDERSKIVLFGFAPGQELSAHTAPYPATLTFLKGEASLRLDAGRIHPQRRSPGGTCPAHPQRGTVQCTGHAQFLPAHATQIAG